MRSNLSKLYRQTQMDAAGSGRQVEISILEMAAGRLRATIGGEGDLGWSRELDEALRFNQKIWDVFTADWSQPDCALDRSTRESLLSLAAFVKKRTFALMAKPDKTGVNTLIALNESLITGLRARPERASAPA